MIWTYIENNRLVHINNIIDANKDIRSSKEVYYILRSLKKGKHLIVIK